MIFRVRSRALPARFRRHRLLIVGCGDVGMRVVRKLDTQRMQVLALNSTPERAAMLRAAGIRVLSGNLDAPATLHRLAGLAHSLLHLAPPGAESPEADPRTRALIGALRRGRLPRRVIYGSTSGVYGNRGGQWTDETAPCAPLTARARRRVDAEQALRQWGRAGQGLPAVRILRIPGIYAPDREGGTPRERLLRGTPVLAQQDDVFTNHIHADDLARACLRALWKGAPQRIYNANDDSCSRMGDYVDLAADLYGLPRPPRLPWEQAREQLPATLLSFMQESRRLHNRRLKRELGLVLRYPTPAQGLQAATPIAAATIDPC